MYGYICESNGQHYAIINMNGEWKRCDSVAQLARLMQITHAAISGGRKAMEHFYPIGTFIESEHKITHTL